MKPWVGFFSILAINFLAARLAFAQQQTEQAPPPAAVTAPVQATATVDECKETLPQLEEQYSQVSMDIRNLNQTMSNSHDGYVQSFQTMTEALVDLSHKKEDELQKISESRAALEQAMQKFKDDQTSESSKAYQDGYLDLTAKIYSQAMTSQQTIDTLKNQFSQVELARNQFETTQKSQADLDQKKLALESKLASLKIRCQKN